MPAKTLIVLLMLSALVGCTEKRHPAEIDFSLNYNGLELTCDNPDAAVSLTDLRFYVHNMRFIGPDNRQMTIEIIPDDTWQDGTVALLDFENGQGTCINGSSRTNRSVRVLLPDIDAGDLAFEIGVPASLNHADPLLAGAPLNYTDMHWHWASGYKFLRAGVQTANDGFWMHLGSSRCEGTIGNIQGCKAQNRPRIRLNGFTPGEHSVSIDLAVLLPSGTLEDGLQTDCSSGPAEQACELPFSALGIDFASGESVTSAALFGLAPIE